MSYLAGADRLANVAQQVTSQSQVAHQFKGATVSGINADGTVDIRYLGGYHEGIECMSSYNNRVVGDSVVIRDNGVQWIVLGKTGGSVDGSPEISWGAGVPVGSDWVEVVTGNVYIRPGQLYFKNAALTGSNSLPTSQSVIAPGGGRAHLDNSWAAIFGDRPIQGVNLDPIYGDALPWRGAWYYGSDVTTAAAAKAVRGMELRIARGVESLGLDEPVIPQIYTHNQSSAGTSLTLLDGPYQGPALEYGQSAWWPVPRPLINQFIANTNKGFAIFSDKSEEFMVTSEDCGDVRIIN